MCMTLLFDILNSTFCSESIQVAILAAVVPPVDCNGLHRTRPAALVIVFLSDVVHTWRYIDSQKQLDIG